MKSKILLGISVLLMVAALYMVFIYVPTEKEMGIVQRIFYLMVPLAWLAMLSFIIIFIGSIFYLVKRGSKWDILAHSSAEVGIVFTTLALIVGSIWAKPIWGVWWTWEPRLTATLVLWFIYIAYLMVRSFATQALAQIADVRAVRAALTTDEAPRAFWKLMALKEIDESTINQLQGLLDDPDPQVRRQAAEVLSHLGEERSAESLAATFGAEPWLTSTGEPARAGQSQPSSEHQCDNVTPLLKALHDPVADVRLAAAEALGKVGDASSPHFNPIAPGQRQPHPGGRCSSDRRDWR